ncbi:hypothetical protein EYF80_013247 [Liparis tanakae]|uniref:Uncharacterized protein n=1 Tax=Liparis tanakae TaxID=230148 RepID=A0A4Z2IFI4_9TELE|nr:hypothetical protein EYF80_013247 [Liparis tanakae]
MFRCRAVRPSSCGTASNYRGGEDIHVGYSLLSRNDLPPIGANTATLFGVDCLCTPAESLSSTTQHGGEEE